MLALLCPNTVDDLVNDLRLHLREVMRLKQEAHLLELGVLVLKGQCVKTG